jgi:hypothetical protein
MERTMPCTHNSLALMLPYSQQSRSPSRHSPAGSGYAFLCSCTIFVLPLNYGSYLRHDFYHANGDSPFIFKPTLVTSSPLLHDLLLYIFNTQPIYQAAILFIKMEESPPFKYEGQGMPHRLIASVSNVLDIAGIPSVLWEDNLMLLHGRPVLVKASFTLTPRYSLPCFFLPCPFPDFSAKQNCYRISRFAYQTRIWIGLITYSTNEVSRSARGVRTVLKTQKSRNEECIPPARGTYI